TCCKLCRRTANPSISGSTNRSVGSCSQNRKVRNAKKRTVSFTRSDEICGGKSDRFGQPKNRYHRTRELIWIYRFGRRFPRNPNDETLCASDSGCNAFTSAAQPKLRCDWRKT